MLRQTMHVPIASDTQRNYKWSDKHIVNTSKVRQCNHHY